MNDKYLHMNYLLPQLTLLRLPSLHASFIDSPSLFPSYCSPFSSPLTLWSRSCFTSIFGVYVSFSKIPFSHFHSQSKWLSSASFDTPWLSQRIQLSAKLHKILKSTAATFIEIMSCIRCHQQNDPVELQLDSLHNVMNDMKNESNAYAATHIQTHTNNSEKKNSNRTTLRWILLNWAEQSWAEPNQVKLS